MEYGRAFRADVIDPVEHQTMQVNVQVGRRAKALNEGDGAGGRFAAFDARLLGRGRLSAGVRAHCLARVNSPLTQRRGSGDTIYHSPFTIHRLLVFHS